MRIAILSDIHDNLGKLEEALDRARDADAIVCCGDLCSPFVVPVLGRGFEGPVHVVFGNNDGDRFRIALQAREYPNVALHGEFVELELDGRRFAVQHFDDIARAIAGSGRYDVVCYGHTHRYEMRREGRSLIVNPGEIYGGLTGRSSYVIYDTATGEGARVEV